MIDRLNNENLVHQQAPQNPNECVIQHNSICSHIYKRANKKKNIVKGQRCNIKPVIAKYASDGKGGYFCRSHAQNKETYKIQKRENKKVGKKVKKTNKTKQRSTRSTKIQTRSTNRSTNSLNTNKIGKSVEIVGVDLAIQEEEIEKNKDLQIDKQIDSQLLVYLHSNCNVSASACEKISTVLTKNGKMSHQISRNTVIRDTVTQAIKCDFLCAELLLISQGLGIGIDEASKKDGRSNLEIEIYGRVNPSEHNHWYISLRVKLFFIIFRI